VDGSEPLVRAALPADAAALAAIYNHYVEHTVVTFDERPVAADDFAGRLDAVLGAGLPWLVAAAGERVLGYAYATRWKPRAAYRHSVETSVYLEAGATGRGLGTRLCEDLFGRLEGLGMHAVISGIALPNPASVRIHERLGMRRVALFEQGGFKVGRGVDVGYWQVLFSSPRPGRAEGVTP
jgi:phosphinothricin acetyltransferase